MHCVCVCVSVRCLCFLTHFACTLSFLSLHRSKLIKEVCAACLERMLDSWSEETLAKSVEMLCEGLHKGLEDASPKVRTCCRSGFYRLRELFPDAAEGCVTRERELRDLHRSAIVI